MIHFSLFNAIKSALCGTGLLFCGCSVLMVLKGEVRILLLIYILSWELQLNWDTTCTFWCVGKYTFNALYIEARYPADRCDLSLWYLYEANTFLSVIQVGLMARSLVNNSTYKWHPSTGINHPPPLITLAFTDQPDVIVSLHWFLCLKSQLFIVYINFQQFNSSMQAASACHRVQWPKASRHWSKGRPNL